MNEDSTYTDLLIQYLDGELSGEELESFEKNLQKAKFCVVSSKTWLSQNRQLGVMV